MNSMAQLPMDTEIKAAFDTSRTVVPGTFNSKPSEPQYNSEKVLSNFNPDEIAHLMAQGIKINNVLDKGGREGAQTIASMTKTAGQYAEADITNLKGPGAGGGVETPGKNTQAV